MYILLFLWLTLVPEGFAAELEGFRSERRMFLNGVEITGSTDQDLKDVDIHISPDGDLFITADHYKVFYEERYVPIRSVREAAGGMQHKPPREFVPAKTAPFESMPEQGDPAGGLEDASQVLPAPQSPAGEVPAPMAEAMETQPVEPPPPISPVAEEPAPAQPPQPAAPAGA